MAALRKTWGGRAAALALMFAGVIAAGAAARPQQKPSEFRLDYAPAAYAIRGATVVASPGRTIEDGTVVVREGRIEAVGPSAEVALPFDAEVLDGKGLHVYPGFLDLYTTLGVPADAVRSSNGAGRTVPYADFAYPRTPADNRNGLTPEFQVATVLNLPASTIEERRGLGFTDLVVAPGGAGVAGQGALVSLSGLPRREAIIRSPLALHIAFRRATAGFGDDDHAHDHDHEAMAQLPGTPAVAPPSQTPSPAPATPPSEAPGRRRGGGLPAYPGSLMGEVAHLRQAMLDSEYQQTLTAAYEKGLGPRPPVDAALRTLAAAKSRQIPVWWEANTADEIHRALDLAVEFGTTAVIVGGREAGKVAGRLRSAQVPVVLRLDFPEEPKVPTEDEYRKKPAEEREEPLRALVEKKARWSERVGTARALHAAGVRFAFSSDGVSKAETFPAKVRQAVAAGLPKDAAIAALTRDAAEIVGLANRLGTIERGKLGHLVAFSAPYGDESARARHVLADGFHIDLSKAAATAARKGGRGGADGKKAEPGEEPEKKKDVAKAKIETPEDPKRDTGDVAGSKQTPDDEPKKEEPKKEEPKKEEPKAAAAPFVDVATEFDQDRAPKLQTGGNVLIKDATILAVTQATIPRGSILIRGGKIAEVGEAIAAPAGFAVIDAAGLVAMPGIIDTHSHMAISGGVNEATLSIVPEVRVRDAVRGDDVNIYRQAAGGVTASRLLHGSANTIGGQDAVIKLRYGRDGRDLVLKGGPQGVKFALGENVTRLTGRFPNTRMGVEATIERAFEEGRAYRSLWKAYEARKAEDGEAAGPPPRRDLRLEALANILDGQILIHSHCYRADEILMLLRAAERHGVRVQSLQHVLEGYKVAAEIAEHGASASTFPDWWAYKVEAYDAIPYNAALLAQAGANVCIKSDSNELARHLYLEAAKMVKYGGATKAQALAMITINPARELGLDRRLGSIEVGKDGDIALFNGHPLDGFSRCEMTLVEGEVTFQRKEPDGTLAPRGREFAGMPAPVAGANDYKVDLTPSPDGLYALVGATLHPVSGPAVDGGVLVIRGGEIEAVGGAGTPVPPGAKTIDLKGLDVWPGMIDAGNVVGLSEVGSLRETQDFSDSAQFQPELMASSALRPDSEVIPVTRANGVLAVLVTPSGGTIAGQACLAALDGWVPPEMVVLDQAALVVNIPAWVSSDPEARPSGVGPEAGGSGGDPARQRKERIEAIKELFRQSLAYRKVMAEAARRGEVKAPDPRLAALAPYAAGERPVIFRADRRGEILDALAIAKELELKAIISGGGEAWKVAEQLKAADVPVLIAGTLRLPNAADEPYDAPYANPARLQAAGVRFAIRADTATNSRNLPFEAAMAVAYGLPEAEGVKAVTLSPAEILGVAHRMGSLEIGKRADLVITAGHLLQPTTQVKGLFLGGKPLPPESKHTRLYETYKGRLADVKAGKAPLGLVRPTKSPAPSPTPAAGAAGVGSDGNGSGAGDRR